MPTPATHAFSRRQFLATASAGAALLGWPAATRGQTPAATISRPRGQARNVIFLVADGMCQGALSLTDIHSRLTGGPGSEWMRLYREGKVRRALQETRSASSIVTDSAAASSSWGCGQRVNNRAINYSPEEKPLVPLAVKAKEAGKSVGMVTTCRITHATPAGLAAQVPHRDQEDEIAAQYLRREIDVLLGGGLRHFLPMTRADERDLWAEYEKAGYRLARSKIDLLTVPTSPRLLGCFANDHLPYQVDARQDEALQRTVPTLADMTDMALRLLDRNPEGFVLQVEGGRVDHAAHSNDAAALLQEMLAFDEALALVWRFVARRDDTLLIITTDHGTGGCNINGEGSEYANSETMVRNLGKWKVSFGELALSLPARPTVGQLQETLEDLAAISLSGTEARHFLSRWTELPESADDEARSKLFGVLFGPMVGRHTAVGWTSQNHTGEFVELAAHGPGSERIAPFIENFRLHAVMLEAMGLAVRA